MIEITTKFTQIAHSIANHLLIMIKIDSLIQNYDHDNEEN